MEDLSPTAAAHQKSLRQLPHSFVRNYLDEIRRCLDQVSEEEVEQVLALLREAYHKDRTIFIIGNGGSASTASHFATDLGKGTSVDGARRFRTMSLTDNAALISAVGNDIGFEHIFVEQLKPWLEQGDVLLVISGSGNSPNIVAAVEYARSRKALTIGLLGFGGGIVKPLLDASIVLPAQHYGHVESVHLVLEHLISNYFMRELGVPGY
ncbi:MAG: SIS domain-containing protein [Acidobacteriota bacterium]